MTETLPIEQQDERAGLASASSFDRLWHCAGSLAAERGLPDLPQDGTAEEGTDIHEALHTGDDSELAMTPRQIAARLAEMEQRAAERWAEDFDIQGQEVIRESRLWFRDPKTLEVLGSAKPDIIRIGGGSDSLLKGSRAIVTDFKSGFVGATPSELNWQLRVQALCVRQNYHVQHVRAAIAHSRLSSKFDSVDFDLGDLNRVEREIIHTVWRANQPDAPRVPGPHCRYCKANGGVCREKAVYDQISSAQLPVVAKGKPDQMAILDAVQRLTPQEMAFLYQRKPSMEFAYTALEHRLKALPEDVLQTIGYHLADGNKLREVIDPATAFARLAPLLKHEAGDDRLLGLKLTIGKMADALADRLNISVETAKHQIYEAMEGTFIEKQGSKRLKRL